MADLSTCGIAASARFSADEQTTRVRILITAEYLFSQRGYAAATVREITRHAEVPLGLMNHYFGSKEDLFREVIARRAVEHIAAMHEALDEAIATAHGAISVEAFITAYVGPLIELSASGDAGWKNYAQLLGLTLNSRHYEPFLQPMIAFYDPLNRRFTDCLQAMFPQSPPEQIYWAIYFLHSSIVHVLVEAGMVDRQSGGLCRSSDLRTVFGEMVPFFSAAFRARLSKFAIVEPS